MVYKANFMVYKANIAKTADSKIASSSVFDRKFSNKLFVIDRLHYKNHTRKTCSTFRCDNYEELKGTNFIPCEETNYWFGKYKYIFKHMNFDRFMFYLFIICDHFNKN